MLFCRFFWKFIWPKTNLCMNILHSCLHYYTIILLFILLYYSLSYVFVSSTYSGNKHIHPTEKVLIFEIYAITALSDALHWDLKTVDFKFYHRICKSNIPQTYLVPSRTFRMELFAKTGNVPCKNIKCIIVTTFAGC